ncbi:predicted protein [Naegleria gruberi]|uniref:Predicted protein n=1 Tax=Naegleria gruberi TaxID=5762 RepID=D2VB60_NAEGR|nr:uncharacterized protein NAEGRDRAFT_66102 [Naegleria gruberi]EFC45740.1 predicted protein [Naegleria gruberi]|eukprot:XP_002678484.1 predicted protein [Naegleria gruberi strain NEG-M]
MIPTFSLNKYYYEIVLNDLSNTYFDKNEIIQYKIEILPSNIIQQYSKRKFLVRKDSQKNSRFITYQPDAQSPSKKTKKNNIIESDIEDFDCNIKDIDDWV